MFNSTIGGTGFLTRLLKALLGQLLDLLVPLCTIQSLASISTECQLPVMPLGLIEKRGL